MSSTKHQDTTPYPEPEDQDDDALFEALENEDDSGYRENRIEQLSAEYASAKNDPSFSSGGGGGGRTIDNNNLYPTLDSDQAVLDFTTNTHRCVVHFAHPDFARCAVMDEQMRALAARHEVQFLRVDVRNTPFIVEKLNIRVLPCVIGFKDGVGVERVVGFEGLGSGGRDGTDGFSIGILEKRLLWKGILIQSKIKQDDEDSGDSDPEDSDDGDGEASRRDAPGRAIRSGGIRLNQNDDDDDDWE